MTDTFKYVFKNTHNGHTESFMPFLSDRRLTQEEVNKIMEEEGSCFRRVGSSLEDLKRLASQYRYNIRPLNDSVVDYRDWPIIEGITGNY